MTPERIAALVGRWVRFYTRDMPVPIAKRRVNEIDADLHDHIAHERAHGTSDRRISLSILSRMVRGLPADASWSRQAEPLKRSFMKTLLTILAALALVVAGINAILYGEVDGFPGGELTGAVLVVGGVWWAVKTVRTVLRAK